MIIDAHTHGFHTRYVDQLADAGGDRVIQLPGLVRVRDTLPHGGGGDADLDRGDAALAVGPRD